MNDPIDDLPYSLYREVFRKELNRRIDRLSDRERLVIGMRFGIRDGTPYGLNAIGEELGVSRERVRQIEMRAINILRQP